VRVLVCTGNFYGACIGHGFAGYWYFSSFRLRTSSSLYVYRYSLLTAVFLHLNFLFALLKIFVHQFRSPLREWNSDFVLALWFVPFRAISRRTKPHYNQRTIFLFSGTNQVLLWL
jgi:hypothetical protein